MEHSRRVREQSGKVLEHSGNVLDPWWKRFCKAWM